MKHELGRKIIKEFLELRTKTYSKDKMTLVKIKKQKDKKSAS